jgi:hypothetical protein
MRLISQRCTRMDNLAKMMFMTLKEWRRILILQLLQVGLSIGNFILTHKHCSGDQCKIQPFDYLGLIPKIVCLFLSFLLSPFPFMQPLSHIDDGAFVLLCQSK